MLKRTAYHKCFKRYMSLNPNLLLSAENKQKCMRKFQDMVIQQGSVPATKRAAVLIPIIVQDNEVSLLYTVRAASLKYHRGQVSFPGGMAESTDSSVEQTALRETEEEIGIDPTSVQVWGRGKPIIRRDLAIEPVVGRLSDATDLKKLKLNQDEVEDIFVMNVKNLDTKHHRHTQFKGSYSTPTYLGGPHRIWGLTAVITFMFLKSLLSPEMYKYQVNYIPNVTNVINKRK